MCVWDELAVFLWIIFVCFNFSCVGFFSECFFCLFCLMGFVFDLVVVSVYVCSGFCMFCV